MYIKLGSIILKYIYIFIESRANVEPVVTLFLKNGNRYLDG